MPTFILQIPESNWRPIDVSAQDGRLVWIRDGDGNVDLAQWDVDLCEWNGELGTVGVPRAYADVAIIGYPDRNGRCGRCGRVRSGP